MVRIHTLVALAALSVAAAPGWAQPAATTAQPAQPAAATPAAAAGAATPAAATAGAVAAMDKEFMTKAAEGGLAEVAMGNLAQQKATAEDVKAFGQRMVTDHSKANEELKALAGTKGVTLPTEPGKKEKMVMDKLGQLSGDAFDKAYMRVMVRDHKHDVAEFEKASTSAQDPDLKNWAGKTLPVLKEHLDLATKTAEAHGVKPGEGKGEHGGTGEKGEKGEHGKMEEKK